MKVTFKNKTDEGISLKSFLTLKGVSHRLYAKLKESGNCFSSNGQSFSPQQKVQPNQEITIRMRPEVPDPKVLVSNQPLDVVYEDENWLVVNKPAGLTSVPGPANSSDTLVNRIKGHLTEEGAENQRPHLITRLDRYTSGLVLTAKNQFANSWAQMELKKKQIKKEYVALVSGHLAREEGIIDKPVGPVPGQFFRKVQPSGKPAQTKYQVIKRMDDFDEVKVDLLTGRTHQIRAHFTYLGHPLLGDQLYNGDINKEISYQALCANYLAFYDPFTEKERVFTVKLPPAIFNLVQ